VVKNLSLAVDDVTAAFQLADLSGDADLAHFVNVADAAQVNASADPAATAPQN
jgi:hypothetical protein